ncbi:hypothetical protein Tco_1372753, partial [Tanacetum coccineum]
MDDDYASLHDLLLFSMRRSVMLRMPLTYLTIPHFDMIGARSQLNGLG